MRQVRKAHTHARWLRGDAFAGGRWVVSRPGGLGGPTHKLQENYNGGLTTPARAGAHTHARSSRGDVVRAEGGGLFHGPESAGANRCCGRKVVWHPEFAIAANGEAGPWAVVVSSDLWRAANGPLRPARRHSDVLVSAATRSWAGAVVFFPKKKAGHTECLAYEDDSWYAGGAEEQARLLPRRPILTSKLRRK